MSKRNKKGGVGIFSMMKEETRHIVISILFFVIAVILALSSFGLAGFIGEKLYTGLHFMLGVGYFMLPILFLLLGVSFARQSRPNLAIISTIGAILFLLSSLGLVAIFGDTSGGLVGNGVAKPLVSLFDSLASVIILVAIFFVSIVLIFDTKPDFSFGEDSIWKKILGIFRRKKVTDEGFIKDDYNENEDVESSDTLESDEETEVNNQETDKDESTEVKQGRLSGIFSRKVKSGDDDMSESLHVSHTPFSPPPLSILDGDKGKPGVGDIKANANIIKRTLQNFGISVEMDEISIGPSVTRYSMKPAEGVKLSRIVGLQNELALALAVHPVRIDAPIPGTSLVGIEVPNSTRTTVGLRTLLGSEEFTKNAKFLPLALGRDVAGGLHFADLAKMPHLLIAGATGAGKSVTIHTIINSILFRNSPENLRFIMVDPKRVELTLYNNIPHLLTPVITDAKKTILALKWAAKEMDRRYDILEAEKVRDIASYHKNIFNPAFLEHSKKSANESEDDTSPDLPERMPYIVIVIDELADIMASYPRELESAVVRLAQMSRAVGIHLVLSTQRPSVNVITGLIKANIPARIALQVSSQIDSRTILDTGGAEKLLGAGDLLYLSGDMSKPVRLQSAYISEEEVKKVVKYLSKNYDSSDDAIVLTDSNGRNSIFETSLGDDEDADDDELYEEAREVVISAGKASSSYLQRKLKVGYARAARLIDMLEERGVVSSQEGSRPREVLDEYRKEEETQ